MITVTDEDLDQRNPKREVVLSTSAEAVLQNALVCYREALVMDLDALRGTERMERIAQGTERTIAQVDHLLEVLA